MRSIPWIVLLTCLLLGWVPVRAQSGGTENPHGNLALACNDCHTTEGWNPVKPNPVFDHQTTNFPLVGRHVQVQCASCHKSLVFSQAGTQCKDCHLDIHRGQFAYACSECHTPNQWNNEREMFLRHQQTRFPLTGVHSNVDCDACHANGQYAGLATDCASCHLQSFESTTNPSHVASQFSKDCSQCHTVTSSRWQNATFVNHAVSGFALTGQHNVIACAACHEVNGQAQYTGLPTDCYSCHQTNFQSVSDPNHVMGNFGHNCSICHTTNAWNPAIFDHSLSGFMLTGAHAGVACAECHTLNGQPRYSGTPSDCFSCHESSFQTTTNPNHVTGNFPHDCAQCHTTSGWQPATFDHNLSSFPLTGAHVNVQCSQCHVNGQFANTPTDCYTCHTQSFNGADNPNHATQNFPHDCTVCHNTAAWQPSTFDHATSPFPLTGAHVNVQCAQCHVNGQFANTPTDCYTCHTQDFNGAANPNHATQNFPHDCTVCHNTSVWQPSTFNHQTSIFPLTGRHTSLSCAQCHVNGQFANTPTDCYTCHTQDFNGATDPNHVALGYPHDCTLCHTTNGWDDGNFNHSTTGFPLNGAHASTACNLCHINGQFPNTPTDCYSCHTQDFNGSNNPNHASQNFPHDCTVCHNTVGWQPSTFDHQASVFPLTGAHASLQCAQCHVNGQFANTPTDCYSCHTQDFNSTNNPNHAAQNFPHDCTICHSTNVWQPSTFDHQASAFPLTGRHTSVSCAQCHINGQYAGTPTDCYSCHQADYEGTRDPNHVALGYPHNCSQCHTTNGWDDGGGFDHSNTGFPLTGAHANAQCNACHALGRFAGTPTNCYTCHRENYDEVNNPPHASGGFDHICTRCHTTSAWLPSTFNHGNTSFPLTGAHGALSCQSCHRSGAFRLTPTVCYSCHEVNFDGVTDPNHVTNQFDHNCTVCHSTAAWNPATFDHNSTAFPLTGAHGGVACNQCHINGQYQNTPTACYACHQTDFNGVTDPNHVTNQFDHNCTVCHSTTAWNPATFDHNGTAFPLTGAHVSVACNLCHINGQYQNTPTACYACHQTDFNGVSDPNHVTNQFDHNCTVCHSTSAWNPATFDHNGTAFPLTGAHVSVACNQCHINGQYQGTPTDCYFCHQTDYNNATPNHSAAGFPTTCQTCHNTNTWQGATFNHDAQWFPIYSGHHQGRWSTCADCHTNPNDFAVFSCITCHAHNQQQMDNEHQEVSGYVYDSGHCYQCHPTGGGGGRIARPQPRNGEK
jgi:hypothetical protein